MQSSISIQNLSKKYTLDRGASYIALRDVITHWVKNIFKFKKENKSAFWALDNINLEIEKGSRIGIIGHNGAGKSTLLKIISRITPPTKGKIVLHGSVASLLEVGTGFHPELTGRENIYLNGSILGLQKKEINQRLAQIIEFSGVEAFIDEPLKHYSTGMQLRLAFSVAAHLEPDILLIDEVLAVGDLEFQKKCLGKMEEISNEEGRTVLFVSHNLGFVQDFCNKTILLEKGKLIEFGETNAVIQTYLHRTQTKKVTPQIFGNKSAEVLSFSLVNTTTGNSQIMLGYPAVVKFKVKVLQRLNSLEVAFNINDFKKDTVSHVTSLDKQLHIKAEKDEILNMEIELESINLTPNEYSLDLFILNSDEMAWGCKDYAFFTVINSNKALRPNGFPAHIKMFTHSSWSITNEGI